MKTSLKNTEEALLSKPVGRLTEKEIHEMVRMEQHMQGEELRTVKIKVRSWYDYHYGDAPARHHPLTGRKLQAQPARLLPTRQSGEQEEVEDVQRGINILNGYDKETADEAEKTLVEDGVFGRKTERALSHVEDKYPPSIRKYYMMQGAVSNAIMRAKERGQNPNEAVVEVVQNLRKEI